MRTNVLERNQEIREQYDEQIKAGNDVEATIEKIAKELRVGKFYVRTILKEQGLDIKRKSVYKRKNEQKLKQRDEEIRSMVKAGNSIEDIATKYKITSTRVRQIVRGLLVRNVDFSKEIAEIKKMVNTGLSYTAIVDRFGKDKLKTIKTKSGFNPYRAVLDKQNSTIVKLFNSGMPPLDIANMFGLVRDSVYHILKKKGLTPRMSKEQKAKRDKEIVALSKSKVPVSDIAKKYDLSRAMVKIILKE